MRKKITHLKTAILFCTSLLSTLNIMAQQVDANSAMELIRKNAAAIGLSKTDLFNSRISDTYTDESGITMVYLQQTYKGIDVFNSIKTLAFQNDQLVSNAGKRIANIADMVNVKDVHTSFSAADAVRTTANHLKIPAPGFLAAAKQIGPQQFEFGDLGISSENVKSKLIWLPNDISKTVALSWQVEVQPNGSPDYWLVNVDANKGNVINKINLNVSCDWTQPKRSAVGYSTNFAGLNNLCDDGEEQITATIDTAKYRVIPFPAESRFFPGGTPTVKKNPWTLAGSGNNATTLEWHDNGTTVFDSTRGNNVLAQEDRNGNNGFGLGAVSTTAAPVLTFNFKPNFDQEPTVRTNQKFATTNLFYWNNIMHDLSYQYGFNEVAGNFQANNLSRGGKGNDYVFADAQDGSGTNNANFATPPDGSSPRMQMFLFDAQPTFTVTQPSSFAGNKSAVESDFSTKNKLATKGPISGNVVLYNDAGNTTHKACVSPSNAAQLSGKIALIDRGDCNFTTKVKNAQNAGAIAAIVADNVPGEYPSIMGGTDNTITIPAVMVSFETGDTIKQILAAKKTLSVTMSGGVHLDGDLDNGVICHEYTHGISNRLTGGPSNTSCLNNAEQMGEGWSDYFALMVTTNWSTAAKTDGPKTRPLGTYVLGQTPDGPGIRTYPYSTDMSVDPWTYADLPSTGGEVHTIGEIWCTMVWEMTWDIIQQVGIKPNLYRSSANGGNIIALKLVTMGMKLQPCSPGFVDGRNAILKADTMLYGGVHSMAIWKAFAKRGLGIFASQGSSNSYTDGTADYNVPSFAPIAQSSFNAVKQNETALLQWQNFTVKGSAAFVVERSIDGKNFNKIGTVNANATLNTYNFTDHFPVNGINYYRLSQSVTSGTVYSQVRAINFNAVGIAPNPARDKATITVAGNTKLLKVVLTDATGQQLRSYNMNGEILQAALPHVAAGLYYIKITGDGISETRKLVIQ